MKTVYKILGFIIVLLIVIILLLPVIFKGKITELAKEQINKSVNAKVDFSGIDLSLIRSFPNFSLGISDLTIAGVNDFADDTLAHIKTIDLTVDLMSVIKGNQYEVERITIEEPIIHVKVLESGSANYDIAPEGEPMAETESSSDDGSFALSLKKVQIVNGNIYYSDASMGVVFKALGLNHTLSGNLTDNQTLLKTKTNIDGLTLKYEGVNYFTNTRVNYNADIDADLKNEVYTLNKNELKLNELIIAFNGSVSMVNDDYNLVLTFNAPKTDFKHILSLVPAIYAKDFANIETAGKLAVDGFIKGLYTEKSLPSFAINVSVEDAMFKYPDLPKSVTDIQLFTKVSNTGGSADNTVIDISKFQMAMGSNPIEANLLLKTPVSDPNIKSRIKGKLDLATVSDFYPLEEEEKLSGSFVTDITLEGKLSAVENEKYEDFTAMGSMLIKGLSYKSQDLDQPVEISTAQLNFSPAYIDLVSFKSIIGVNDISAKGKLENFLAYALKDDKLIGNLTVSSNYLNVADFMKEDGEEMESGEIEGTTSMSVVEVPGNIEFSMVANFKKLIYDNIEMENVTGNIEVKDKWVKLKNLTMNILDGKMMVNGSYNTVDIEKPEFDFDLKIDQVDIQQAYNTFGVVSKFAPIAKKTAGKFSTTMNMKSQLDNEMMPKYETLFGSGELFTTPIKIQDVNTLNKIAEVVKIDKLKSMDIAKILFQFEFIDGKLVIAPFDMKYNNYVANLGGSTSIDQSIDYVMNLAIPRSDFGSGANDMLNNLVSQANSKGADFSLGETVNLAVLIGGTLTSPQVRTALKETGKDLIEDMKEQVKEEIEKKKEEISEEAKKQAQKIIDDADAQAQKLIREAEKQAATIRKKAASAAKKITDEADIQAKKVEDEGKKNGFLAEAAAKETAKQIRKEAGNQANNLTSEADKQANAVVNKAKQQAAKLKSNAQKQADDLLKVK